MSGQSENHHAHQSIEDEQQIRHINEAWVDALTHGDTETLNRVMDDQCIFSYVLEGDDKAQFLSDIESGELRVDTLSRENVEVSIYGSTGVLTALDTAVWTYRGQLIEGPYRTLHVYAKREGQWQIVAIQASPLSLN